MAVDDLGASGVVVVEKTAHGALASSYASRWRQRGKPFAVSNRCRHLFAPLGTGRVTDDGCPQCPRHAPVRRRYRRAGAGSSGPAQAAGERCEGYDGARSLKTFPVEVRDGAIWLLGCATAAPPFRVTPSREIRDHFDGRLG